MTTRPPHTQRLRTCVNSRLDPTVVRTILETELSPTKKPTRDER
jgi:hypothetical protein